MEKFMKVKKSSLQSKKDYDYLNRFAKPKYLNKGHNSDASLLDWIFGKKTKPTDEQINTAPVSPDHRIKRQNLQDYMFGAGNNEYTPKNKKKIKGKIK